MCIVIDTCCKHFRFRSGIEVRGGTHGNSMLEMNRLRGFVRSHAVAAHPEFDLHCNSLRKVYGLAENAVSIRDAYATKCSSTTHRYSGFSDNEERHTDILPLVSKNVNIVSCKVRCLERA
jgi:hypothetical protein